VAHFFCFFGAQKTGGKERKGKIEY